MSGWTWAWRISPDQVRALICAGAYSHTQHGLRLTAKTDGTGGVEVEVNVTPEPLDADEGPR
jgi:hypothetical protein